MTRIDELHTRISRALDRIAQGIERWDQAGPAPAAQDAAGGYPEPGPEDEAAVAPGGDPSPGADALELTRLQEALEDERLANAQLTERVRTLRDRLGTETAALREQVETQREGLAQLDGELQRLRQANEALRRSNQALREANAQSVGEPHLINKAMLAELEGLRAARSAEAAEIRLVYDTLQPLLEPQSQPVAEAEEGMR